MSRPIILVAFLLSTTLALSQDQRISRTFPVDGVVRVIVRASAAEKAVVVKIPAGPLKISAIPSGGAAGYHPTDPKWKETPANAWGLDLVSQRHGDTLVVSSKNELGYIHHYYTLEDLRIELPPEIELICEVRVLNGNGAPNLEPPKKQ